MRPYFTYAPDNDADAYRVLCDGVPIFEPLPIQAARNLADRLDVAAVDWESWRWDDMGAEEKAIHVNTIKAEIERFKAELKKAGVDLNAICNR